MILGIAKASAAPLNAEFESMKRTDSMISLLGTGKFKEQGFSRLDKLFNTVIWNGQQKGPLAEKDKDETEV